MFVRVFWASQYIQKFIRMDVARSATYFSILLISVMRFPLLQVRGCWVDLSSEYVHYVEQKICKQNSVTTFLSNFKEAFSMTSSSFRHCFKRPAKYMVTSTLFPAYLDPIRPQFISSSFRMVSDYLFFPKILLKVPSGLPRLLQLPQDSVIVSPSLEKTKGLPPPGRVPYESTCRATKSSLTPQVCMALFHLQGSEKIFKCLDSVTALFRCEETD